MSGTSQEIRTNFRSGTIPHMVFFSYFNYEIRKFLNGMFLLKVEMFIVIEVSRLTKLHI